MTFSNLELDAFDRDRGVMRRCMMEATTEQEAAFIDALLETMHQRGVLFLTCPRDGIKALVRFNDNERVDDDLV